MINLNFEFLGNLLTNVDDENPTFSSCRDSKLPRHGVAPESLPTLVGCVHIPEKSGI